MDDLIALLVFLPSGVVPVPFFHLVCADRFSLRQMALECALRMFDQAMPRPHDATTHTSHFPGQYHSAGDKDFGGLVV